MSSFRTKLAEELRFIRLPSLALQIRSIVPRTGIIVIIKQYIIKCFQQMDSAESMDSCEKSEEQKEINKKNKIFAGE